MSNGLRGEEIPSCAHRVALARGGPLPFVTPPLAPELERRRRLARTHRVAVLDALAARHPEAVRPYDVTTTSAALVEGAPLVLSPRLADDVEGRRRAHVDALVRVGRVGTHFRYAPILIKHHEVVEAAATRRTLSGTLEDPTPFATSYVEGVGVRSAGPMTRSGFVLAHATRVLKTLGHHDEHSRGAVVDRQRQWWWFHLGDDSYPRFNLAAYDNLYQERLDVLVAHDRWRHELGPYPTSPYWHRECDQCPYAGLCRPELEARDDVSLVHYSTLDQQQLLREHGVTTRESLARLDPDEARRARRHPLNALASPTSIEVLGRAIGQLDELIYRARAHGAASPLRRVGADEVGCPRADVEVDVDTESCDEGTYLWGALVTLRQPLVGVEEGYRSFVEWGDLNATLEATNFSTFWHWLSTLRHACREQGRTFSAYCFWAQAEDGAMNRAVATPVAGGPTPEELATFRDAAPSQWHDLHELAARQIQTEGPAGLKQLAAVAGFTWRDANPSGEASMLWHDEAVGEGPVALAARERLLAYNEDDCRATRALREWLNGPARLVAHRDQQC